MTPRKFLASERQVAERLRVSRGLTAPPLVVEQCLAAAEQELRIQFTRIAQLQAELDILSATLRRATDAHAMNLQVQCFD